MIAILLFMLAAPPQRPTQTETARVIQRWMQAAREHQPGQIDAALTEIANASPHDIDIVRRNLQAALKITYKTIGERNLVLRRGALLHTDIALLLPEQAATFTLADLSTVVDPSTGRPMRPEGNEIFYGVDGEFQHMATDSAHWLIARTLLGWVGPHPSDDPFVAAWYRAVTATFENARFFGSAKFHLERGLEVLRNDPVLLFYAGTVHDAYASAAIQSILDGQPTLRSNVQMPPPRDELRIAERLLRQSVEQNGPLEARVRLGRVLGQLGRHADAVSVLREVLPQLRERRLQYFGALFLGSEEGALGHVEQARESLARAAALFPTAQSPWLALSEMFRRTGNRSAALDALQHLQQLPSDPRDRDDPWRDYLESFAADADEQIATVRALVGRQQP